MTATSICVPYCIRASLQPHDGNGISDGFYIVDDGLIVIYHETRKIEVYEYEEWQTTGGNKESKLSIDLVNDVESIEFRAFRSVGRNYAGGRMTVIGTFDRFHKERLIFKTGLEEYRQMREVIAGLGI
jgi:hypothetical protein